MMKIGIDALFEDPNSGTGGRTYLRNMIREIGLLDTQDLFFVFVRDDDTSKMLNFGYPNMRLVSCRGSSSNALGRLFAQHCTLPNLARKLKLDVLLCPGNVAPIFSPVPVVLVVQNRLQYTSYFSKHYALQPVGLARAFYKDVFGRLSLRKAKMILAVSSDVERVLVDVARVPLTKVRVVYLGVDVAHFSTRSVVEADNEPLSLSGYILNVSRLLPSKNQDTLIRAFAAYCKFSGSSRERLIIVGDDFRGRRNCLLTLADKLGIASRVLLMGLVPHDKIAAIYHRASLYVHLSYVESFGFPVLEAMASGVPVVVSNRTALPEVVGDAGVLVDPENIDEIVVAMRRILSESQLRDELVAKGKDRARQMCWTRTAQETLDALRHVAR